MRCWCARHRQLACWCARQTQLALTPTRKLLQPSSFSPHAAAVVSGRGLVISAPGLARTPTAAALSTDTGTDANCCHCRHHLLGSHAPTLTATPKPLLPPPPPPRLMPSVSSAVAVVECLCARHRRSHRYRHRRHHGHRSSISSFLWPAALAAAEDRSVECW